MLVREVAIPCNRPVPISELIQTANTFGCDIFIECEQSKVNAKNYEDLKQRLVIKTPQLLFFFSGTDELEAGNRIGRLFKT